MIFRRSACSGRRKKHPYILMPVIPSMSYHHQGSYLASNQFEDIPYMPKMILGYAQNTFFLILSLIYSICE